MISAGHSHSVVFTDANEVLSWGDNRRGQLGDNTREGRTVPAQICKRNICFLAAGGHHTLALTTDGHLLAWGANDFGQLGDGTTYARSTPVTVMSGGLRTISAGWYHSMALTQHGEVLGWGINKLGQLGDGTIETRKSPISIMASGVRAISAGCRHSFALTEGGQAFSWGANESGQLGDGTLKSSLTPVQILDEHIGIAALSAGYAHSLARNDQGDIFTWGTNDLGQLGDGSFKDRPLPAKIETLNVRVQAIAAGHSHSLALSAAGDVLSWGANDVGQLGDASVDENEAGQLCRPVPAIIFQDYGICSLAVGWNHNLIYERQRGKCWSWGENLCGQVGDGHFAASVTTPALILKDHKQLILEVHPKFFAVTLQQLLDIESKARDIMQSRFRGANTRTIVDLIIRPPTETTNRGYARLLNEGHLLSAEVFVSHCWDASFGSFASAVGSVFNMQKHPSNDPHLWMAMTALWQGGDYRSAVRPGLHPAEGPFAQAMSQVQTCIAVLDDEVNFFNRIWCVWELYLAEMNSLRRKKHGFFVVGTNRPVDKNTIDLALCEASEPEDKTWILDAIASDGLSSSTVAHPASEVRRLYCL